MIAPAKENNTKKKVTKAARLWRMGCVLFVKKLECTTYCSHNQQNGRIGTIARHLPSASSSYGTFD